MKVRGERECRECGTRWSYYETGSVTCPSCGSIHSVGVDDRTEHTATGAALDLTGVRDRADELTTAKLADEAESVCADYVRAVGFIAAGELQPIDDTFLAAQELRHVAAALGRSLRVSDDEEYYFLTLLEGADEGDRPLPTDVPDSMHGPRGLGVATSVEAYRSELRRYLDDHPDPTAARLLSSLNEHRKRVAALDGEVSPRTAESLVDVARAIGRGVAHDDEAAFTEAEHRLETLSPPG